MSSSTAFIKTLGAYKQAIDDDIAAYAAYIRSVTTEQYGHYAALEVDTFLDILSRGGKRIRGALVMVGYEMCGGQNRAMILQAARALEMLHAYLLIYDDVQDRSLIRRGKPSAHKLLAAYHQKHHLRGDAEHAGESLAITAALAGAHAAQVILANLDADPQLRLNVMSITNRSLGITAHGQTYDVMNELVDTPALEDVERTLEWKTAQYSFVNPLHVGMVLAGAGCEATDAITPYALHVGKAFQIIDDILGIFGNTQELGKSPLDDIREGKGTILSVYALEHAAAPDRAFLRACLGNADLTQEEFERCKRIVESSGARAHAQTLADKEAAAATRALQAGKHLWNEVGTNFLEGLTAYLARRSS